MRQIDRYNIRQRMKEFYNTSDAYLQSIQAPPEYYHSYFYLVRKTTPLGSKVLDLACGTGLSSQYLSLQGFNTIGSDISLKFLQSRNNSDYYPVNADALDIPLKDNSIDTVGIFQGIEHITDIEKMLKEMIRVVKAGGWILITVPNWDSPLFTLSSNGGLITRLTKMISGMQKIIRKRVAKSPSFTYVEPRIAQQWSIPDDDVVYYACPWDITRFFRQKGLTVHICWTTSTRLKGVIKFIMGIFAPVVWVVAEKR